MRTARQIAERQDAGDLTDALAGKTDGELKALILAAQRQQRAMRSGKSQLPRLIEHQTAVMCELAITNEAIAALREGRAPKVMPKIKRPISPEARAHMAAAARERMKRLNRPPPGDANA